MERKKSMIRQGTVQKRAKLMFASLSADLKPLFDWLHKLNVIDKRDVKNFSEDPPTFCKQLRSGYILSKLGIVASQLKSTAYSSYVSSSAQTR